MSEYLDELADLGCIVCLLEMGVKSPASIHHTKGVDGPRSLRSDDEYALPLCGTHHQHGPPGVAYHAGPREWEEIHGKQEHLVMVAKRLVELKRKIEDPYAAVRHG